ncbi:MAG: tetratricopeptide repeat protein [Deltaproteobacteria bacterium]|nr:tetratricopeptide repeat protein [Deltaproteobacteria bacterium]
MRVLSLLLLWGLRPGAAALPQAGVDPFASTPEMETWAREATRGCADTRARLACLQRALLEPSFGFDYEASDTLTAVEAFRHRRGNCFTFTALFVSLARATGLRAEMIRVPEVREVDREGSLVVVVRHLAVAAQDGATVTVVDFGGIDRDVLHDYSVVDECEAGAIYHNNRGAQALRDGQAEAALRDLEEAVRLAPGWAEARVNLGVALRRSGHVAGAYDAYLDALRLDPGNASALANLAVLYALEGRPEDQAHALRAAARRGATVYALLALAQVEMAHQDLPAARRALRRARWRDPGLSELHDAWATWHALAGHERAARRHLRKAWPAGTPPTGTPPPP